MTAPKRIQLSRAKGWRKPEGAIVVSRPSRWGNPFAVIPAQMAVDMYRDLIIHGNMSDDFLAKLRGHDLACWCPLDRPCHADVLLELANS